jgi:hyaluronoglucosaminidase
VSRPIPLRGVIEGFYGPPWSHDARIAAIEFLAARGMNAYVYAPKSDPRHRDTWRDPYPDEELARFAELGRVCARVGTRFGFAISPGLDLDYGNATDRATLLAKLTPLLDAGVDWVVLALDDIATRAGLAADQVAVTTWLHDALRERDAPVRLSLVPTEYVGTHPSPYLAELARGLPDDVDVFWTGPTVCSPTISAADATAWRAAVGGRPLIVWDNSPVNDSVMEHELHLGPYRGRDAELGEVVDGVLCNPMLQARASLVPLATAADFLGDPAGYDEAASWAAAIAAVGGDRHDALGCLARACCDGPLATPEELPAHALLLAVVADLDGPAWSGACTAFAEELRALRRASDAFVGSGDPLEGELAPWLAQARREAEAGLAALRLIQQIRPVAERDADGMLRVAAPDAELAMNHCFGLVFLWTAAREGSRAIVLGPRFGLHAAVVQLADGRPALDVDLAVREDRSVIDHLARAALAAYQRWTTGPAAPVQATVDDHDVPIGTDGCIDAPVDAFVIVRAGEHVTQIGAGPQRPPFQDARLA